VLLTISHEEQNASFAEVAVLSVMKNKIDYRAIWTSVGVFSAILLAGVFYTASSARQSKALLAARAEAEAANRSKDQSLPI